MVPPEGPYSWAVSWGFSPGAGLVFEKKIVYDFEKSGFFNRRLLVSRKRTTNVFDLASSWRKAIIHSSIIEEPSSEDLLDTWN